MRLFTIILFLILPFYVLSQQTANIEVSVSVDEKVTPTWKEKGRLVVFFSTNGEREPVFQGTFSAGRNGFAKNISNWDFSSKTTLSGDNTFAASDFTLNSIPEGKWFVQAVYSISENPNLRAAGNLYSEVLEIDIHKNQELKLELFKVIEARPGSEPTDSKMVKYVTLESRLLSDFWGKKMNTEASILLPKNFRKNGSKKYPVRINIGGYSSSWTRASRLESNKEFMDWWLSDDAPEMVQVFLNGANGPFGDPYYLDSENSGPYGSALTQELIPYIEEEFNCIGTPEYRFLDGCSTGGWVSFALQVFYPDYFNGAWSFSADPVDFHHMQLANMYEHKNAFYNQHGYLTPSIRSKTGQPRLSIKAEVSGENLTSFENTYTTSGGQWGGWNALYSPKGKDGLPIAAFDPITGEIDGEAVEHWKKYDLLQILKNNWEELGPKLQGKLWIWMGDMDQFYLNNAMREMEKFLQNTTNPKSDAEMHFEPLKGHCEEFDHRWVLEMMQEKME